MNICKVRRTGDVEEGAGEVDEADDLAVGAAGLDDAGPADHERRAQGFFKDPALVEPAVLAEVEALIAAENDHGVVCEAVFVEVVEHSAHVFIHGLHAGEVVVHVALVAPFHEVATGRGGLAILCIAGFVVLVPLLALLGR